MAIRDVLIPQMGEGLQEVCIIAFQKRPGDHVKRDEILYTMETDKANMDVESPLEGVLQEWLAEAGDVLPIGAPIARMETAETEAESAAPPAAEPAASADTAPAGQGHVQIPPRTRAHARELGVSDEDLRRIPAPSGKLMPGDIDAFLAGTLSGPPYAEHALSPQQRRFAYRIKRSAQVVVPATMRRRMEWGGLHRHVERLRAKETTPHPTDFQTFAYCVAQAAREHPKFRSTLIGDETVREYAHVNLGIAVAIAHGDLVTAVVPSADSLEYGAFLDAAQARIQAAREGEDQATESTQLLLTYLGPYDIVDGVPVLVAPATAVLFLGSPFEENGRTLVNLVLTFDHRLINGIEGAEFLRAIVEKVQNVEQSASV